MHAREDELTSLRSANFLVEQIGGGRARMVVLEDSYHMICVDNDREIVAKNVLEFFGAALPGATSALANEPRMTARGARRGGGGVTRKARRAATSPGLRELAHPRSRVGAAGRQQDVRRAHGQDVRGVREPDHAGARAALHRVRHAGVQSRRRAGAGDARRASRDGATLESQGALLLAYHGGKLLEARWFADDVEREDAFFGEPEPEVPGAASLDADVRRRGRRVEDAASKAPDNDTLLALYSLYKQATVGDVSRRAARRARHGQPREVRRLDGAQGHGARGCDARRTSSSSTKLKADEGA